MLKLNFISPKRTAGVLIEYRTLVNIVHFTLCPLILLALSLILPPSATTYFIYTANVVLMMFVASFTFEFAKDFYFTEKINPINKAVLITGCDTGFGHLLAKRLDSKGFTVFATCLHPKGEGAAELQRSCSNRLMTLELDVTKDESVKNCANTVKENLHCCELWAIVNNSGIQKGFDVELSSIEDYKDTMDVNAFGAVRVTKAFLPLLKKSKGRIVNVTSILGRLPFPYISTYVMSKFAAVAFTECLKQEMSVWGVQVISVEPETFQTEITSIKNVLNRWEESTANLNEDIIASYGENYMEHSKSNLNILCKLGSRNVSIVVDDLESAVSLVHPDSVYKPTRNIFAKLLLYGGERFPKGLLYVIFSIGNNLFGRQSPKCA